MQNDETQKENPVINSREMLTNGLGTIFRNILLGE